MIYRLENDAFVVRVATKGAELQGLYSKKTDREYLWQAAPEGWPDHSLLLFPCCGRIDRSRITVKGREYPLAMHGFAKDKEFTVLYADNARLCLELAYDEDTLRQFPYPFRLGVEFCLTDDHVEENFTVRTDGEETMPFSLGGHPAFFCPVDLESEAEDCVLQFDTPQNILRHGLTDGSRLLIPGSEEPFYAGEREIPLSDHFFDGGPMILSNVKAGSVRLLSKKTGRYMEMGIKDFPFMTLWGQGKRMTVIAIEPWCGTSDVSGTDHAWEKKFGNERVAPGETFARSFIFRLG